MIWDDTQQASLKQRAMAFLSQSFDSFYQHSVSTDEKGIIVWISEAYFDFLGLKESPLGRHISDIIPTSRLPSVIESGQPVFLDLLYISDQWVVISVIPLKDEDDKIIGAFGFVATDSINPLVKKYNKLQNELQAAKDRLNSDRPRYGLSRVIGNSPVMSHVKKQVRQAARFDISVLLTGETGTGKELFAQALHDLSPRSSAPFVSINVAAIPNDLIEAEFFGSVAGAYTGASKAGRKGKLALADGGSLFLDEIGDMPLNVQAKLLRVLQEKEFSALGSNDIQTIDIRIIAATSRDLAAMVEQGEFRADLYYRLNAMPIELPPLRKRLEDVEALCENIIDDICLTLGIPSKQLSFTALQLLRHQTWVGNVRELRNVLERTCVLHTETVIEAEFLSSVLPPSRTLPAEALIQPESVAPKPLAQSIAETERQAILSALSYTQGHKVKTAKLLGISRATLYAKLEKLGLSSE
ncbi:sigma-54 interaction domain-containing protein [Aliamphritea ceti]|uniref:sigma-54 interaction domain-containing protein n=1 Tax=Aliamphritea ceti TaxID=1524258 RepID=UPI0021C3BA95|nr:sigma 54-interacting transcriptional regulator [Aliamphritea ceti]